MKTPLARVGDGTACKQRSCVQAAYWLVDGVARQD